MIRKIIHIDEEKCNGCGACASACQEGAIGMAGGKAKLLRDDYCDGLGNCLPACPTDAISFVEREAAPYDEAAVLANQRKKQLPEGGAASTSATESDAVTSAGAATGDDAATSAGAPKKPAFSGCPGSRMRTLRQRAQAAESSRQTSERQAACAPTASQLGQWPCQIKLVPARAPYFDGAKLLIAADCTAYAYANMHREFMKDRITIIGCPKLDAVDYSEKLTEIIANNDIKSVTVVRMEVPCCGGLEHAAVTALKNSDKFIPWQVVTISIDGNILD